MNKFNRQVNALIKRYDRWYRIARKLSEFEGLINNYEAASPQEVRDMKDMHHKLHECCLTAKHYEEELRPYDSLHSR